MKTPSLLPLLQTQVSPPGYHATRWAWVNRLLAYADRVTGRRAGLLQRLFSFLFIGGLGATISALFSQAIALLTATIFNFVGHHIFTYRRIQKGIVQLKNNEIATNTRAVEQPS